ncbi:MAG: hypothetical protein KatS3mg109_0171 [Pirellulaceae bacterium]|nr:MAG: hypothetical protein KatS3mg109_0171 [Pirellulaceae bacterium]
MLEQRSLKISPSLVREAIEVISSAIENTEQCLVDHDYTLGRTTDKNRYTAELYERQINDMRSVRKRLIQTLNRRCECN